MSKLWLVGAAFLLAGLSACVTVKAVSINQMPPHAARQKVIKARATSPLIFAFHFGSGYIDEAREEFLAQCPNGTIEGTLVKQETTDYFLGVVEVYAVDMQGYCVTHKGTKKA